MKGLWMPVYMYRENKFFIVGNPVYETGREAISHGVGDGFSLLMIDGVSWCGSEAYCIPFTEEEGEWIINAHFPTHEVAIFSGPIWDEEIGDEA